MLPGGGVTVRALMQYGFVIDHRRCIGCHACTVACKSENQVPVGSFRTWVKYTEIGTFPQVRRHFAVLRCNQCTNAPCVTICPVNALAKRPDGIVDLDKDACIGCKACMQACPYDALYLNEDTGGAEKCHFCAHRVEQGLKPACEIVCPTEAIVSGDMHDEASRVSRMKHEADAVARRVEQGTGPNVWYLGMDAVSLHPGRAAEPATYLWSERRLPPPPYPEGAIELAPHARTVLDTSHPAHWGWRVDAYLVTKGLAAGAGMLAPFAAALGLAGNALAYLPEAVALALTAITCVLLVADLKRPLLFFRLLTRPNTKSWLVKGGWVLSGFMALAAAGVALRVSGLHAAADAVRWPLALLGAATAGYTALLFRQCEGRDLWQKTGLLLPHLLVQAVMLGGTVFLLAAPGAGLAWLTAIAVGLHFVCIFCEKSGSHATDNAKQAAALLGVIPAWPGARVSALLAATISAAAAALGLLIAASTATVSVPLALAASLTLVAGTFFWERAYIRAGQLPPLS
ncbi:MAG: 4Fe-4S dicluster domain-containing protein [Planctomycetota bacterium]